MANDSDMLKALVLEAMMKSLDEKKREELLRGALETLITPVGRNVYGARATSPLEDAFDHAISGLARTIVREMLDTDEVKDRVRAIAQTAFQKMASDQERIATAMADALVTAMTRRD